MYYPTGSALSLFENLADGGTVWPADAGVELVRNRDRPFR